MPFLSHRLLLIAGLITGLSSWGAPPSVANISSRGDLNEPGEAFIVGFVVTSPDIGVLLRAIGPSLAQFDIPSPLADPVLKLYNAEGSLVAEGITYAQPPGVVSDPTGQIAVAEYLSGAFPISRSPPTLDQAALVYNLSPGAYTLHITSQTGGKGTVLGEVYFLEDITGPSTN